MSAVVSVIPVVWLALGGWAFATSISKDDSKGGTLALFLFCVFLAPFAAGAAFAQSRREERKKQP